MRKIPIKTLRKIVTKDRGREYHKSFNSTELARKFKRQYLNAGEWNDEAIQIQVEYAEFVKDITKDVPFYHCTVEDKNKSSGTLRLLFKLYKNGTGPQYGASFNFYRLFIYGYPRELRNALIREDVHKVDIFEETQFKMDAEFNGKVTKMRTDVAEGLGISSNTGITVYGKGTIGSIDTKKNNMTVFGDYNKGMIPSHIPASQTYRWAVKHLSIEDNFKHYIEKICIDDIECCGLRLKSLGVKEPNYCPKCGGKISKLLEGITLSNFRQRPGETKVRHTSEKLKLEDVPYEYVMTRRQRTSKVPIF